MTSDFEQDDGDFSLEEDLEDINTEREENYKERFTEAREEIKVKKRFVDSNDVDQFFKNYGDIVGRPLVKPAGNNLLHILVNVVTHNGIKPEHIELLVRRLVCEFPALLKYENEERDNPIFLAIKASHHRLVDYMITACAAMKSNALHEQCLNDALSMKIKDGKTCLHLAIEMKFDEKTKRMLIENASDEALAVQDDVGKTPMHYAVVFKRCSDTGAELVNLFIERDLKAIRSKQRPPKTFLDLSDNSGASVYWQHQTTRRSGTKAYDDWLANRRQPVERSTQDLPQASISPGKSLLGEPSSRTSTRPSRYMALSKPAGNQGDRLSGDSAGDGIYDQRELQRQRKKAEEAENLGKPELAARADHIKERDIIGRDASQTRSIKLGGPEEGAAQSRMNRTVNSTSQLEAMPNMSIKRRVTARVDAELDQAEERPVAKAQQKNRDPAEYMSVRMKNSEHILLSLKLHYMRTRSTEMAISFLYGSNMQDIQVSFDYDSLPRKMPWNEFLKRFGADASSDRLRFDNVLQYVTFPKVQVYTKGRHADREREAEELSGVRQTGALGRKDMKYFFDWLHNKGVRHIITLSVEDSGNSGETVHSDQAIQESLERFSIEHLDWKKTDLDPETILHVSSKAAGTEASVTDGQKYTQPVPQQLRQLSLRWGGSNSVLRAWSEPEGLPLLPQLQRIYIYKPSSSQEYDSPQWISRNINRFQARLNANRKAIRDREITVPSGPGSIPDVGAAFSDVEVVIIDEGKEEERTVTSRDTSHFATSSVINGVNSHRWLDSTTRFAGEMAPFWRNTVKEFLASRHNPGTTERIEGDVIVALIDDGVDRFDTSLPDRILEGKSFDFHNEKVRPSFVSAAGHGTVMASMILRICPMAKVYPIRLRTYPNANGKSNIDAEYAAQAILAALNKKATIISMSWTLPMSEDKSGSKDRLHNAIQKAVDSKALMFCSAPDEGKFTKLDYPSGPWRERFFRIGAARSDGTVFQWTPEDGITYVLPGVEVVRDQISGSSFDMLSAGSVTKRVEDFKYETGSSVATALAAGLAAMIIYCVKASIMNVKIMNQNKDPIVGIAIGDNDANLIAVPDAMKRAFSRLGTVTANNFIQIWEKLDGMSETLEMLKRKDLSQEESLKYIKRFIEFGSILANSIKP
ncbi:hypothetical protein Trco_007419 [Trichoderma cornu-damae]|uniref:Peptidase S8/S53 domain-containing protein n=1 Tax=Trichoderma cornu-damae TaxID=654480 RepID=A0A9P8QJQ7_9HYPO|nr:hypothetical protein Trco_007419 [Trichoderma cornu-damae]